LENKLGRPHVLKTGIVENMHVAKSWQTTHTAVIDEPQHLQPVLVLPVNLGSSPEGIIHD
jgi:hypothetical protein